MKVAVIGSRNLTIENLNNYLPYRVTEIVSGGAKGIDTSARTYALNNNIPLTEFIPDYKKFGKSAPLKRNLEIIKHSYLIIAFWDGKSRGTKYVIDNCKIHKKTFILYILNEKGQFEKINK